MTRPAAIPIATAQKVVAANRAIVRAPTAPSLRGSASAVTPEAQGKIFNLGHHEPIDLVTAAEAMVEPPRPFLPDPASRAAGRRY